MYQPPLSEVLVVDRSSAGDLNSTVVIHNISSHSVGNYTKLSCMVLMHWYVCGEAVFLEIRQKLQKVRRTILGACYETIKVRGREMVRFLRILRFCASVRYAVALQLRPHLLHVCT